MRRTWMVVLGAICVGLFTTACSQKVARESAVPSADIEVEPSPDVAVTEDNDVPWFHGMNNEELNRQAEFEGFHSKVFFQFDSDQLSDEAQGQLRENAIILMQNPALQLTIEGHTDDRGTQQYNLDLGERRAQSVMEFLASVGGSSISGRMSTVSFGEDRPVCTESTEACWARNRRDFLMLSK